MLHWENMGAENGPSIQRAKVPGGWLVLIKENVAYGGYCGADSVPGEVRPALTFVPDPDWLWFRPRQ